MRLTTFATVPALAVTCCLAARLVVAWPAAEWLPDGARLVLVTAATNNPRIAAAAWQQAAGADTAHAFDGFYQPRLGVSAGAAHGPASAPESRLLPRTSGDTVGIEAGIKIPLRVGAYLGAGVAQRYLFEADGFDDLGQSVAGVRLEVPLLQDRGFRSQIEQQAALDATAASAAATTLDVGQTVAREALNRYAAQLYAAADLQASTQALRRVERLLEETSGRIELQTMAEYQLFGARMEVSFRQEELRQAVAVLTQASESLITILGGSLPPQLPCEAPLLHTWALHAATTSVERIMAHGRERPEVTAARHLVAAAERRTAAAREGVRSSLSLRAGVGYQGEDLNGGLGRHEILDDNRAGVELSLVWSRPLAFDAESATLRASESTAAAARATLRQVLLEVNEQQAQAEAAVASARERLGLVEAAVDNARRALSAEEQRLALGEGSNRSVLDAQKDLTTAERRANVAALDMVVAFTDLLYTRGVPLLPHEVKDVTINPAP